jgi:alanyl-tRNA synthetase
VAEALEPLGSKERESIQTNATRGPHVTHTGRIDHFKLVKEEAVAAGIRRIRGIVE